jgi:hypothetical protein
VEQLELLEAQGLAGFALQHLEQQGELGDLHGLGVDVHAIQVGQQDALALAHGEAPAAFTPTLALPRRGGGNKRAAQPGVPAPGEFLRPLGGVLLQVPVQQVLVGADEEGTGAAGGVADAQFFRLPGRSAFQQPAHGLADDVVDDVGGGVVDAAGLRTSGFSSTLAWPPAVRRMTLPRKRS